MTEKDAGEFEIMFRHYAAVLRDRTVPEPGTDKWDDFLRGYFAMLCELELSEVNANFYAYVSSAEKPYFPLPEQLLGEKSPRVKAKIAFSIIEDFVRLGPRNFDFESQLESNGCNSLVRLARDIMPRLRLSTGEQVKELQKTFVDYAVKELSSELAQKQHVALLSQVKNEKKLIQGK